MAPVESCPLTKLNGGLSWLHSADEDAVSWLTSYGSLHAYEKKKNGPWLVAETTSLLPLTVWPLTGCSSHTADSERTQCPSLQAQYSRLQAGCPSCCTLPIYPRFGQAHTMLDCMLWAVISCFIKLHYQKQHLIWPVWSSNQLSLHIVHLQLKHFTKCSILTSFLTFLNSLSFISDSET